MTTPRRGDFRHATTLRVRWAEVDMQGIVFNGHYLMYFDSAVAGYWRAMAMPYRATMDRLEGDLYVRKAGLEYLASARYDERLDVGLRCTRVGRTSIAFAACVFRAETPLVHGELVYVFADPPTQTPKPVPDALRASIEAFEAGQPMLQVEVGPWHELGPDAAALRHAVFVDEQRIPADLERDEADAGALHALARNRFGMALGTGRIVAQSAGVSKVGRMAVLESMRSAGVGRALLDALVDAARRRGDGEVMLHAQRAAIEFYRRAGFRPRGAPFDEAGIPHQEMVLGLR